MMIDCSNYQDLLFASLERRADEVTTERMRRHEGECADCRELAATLRGESEAAPAPADLVAGIMEATGGTACEQAQMLLAAGDRAEDVVLRLHVDACEGCAAVERVLDQVRVELPLLAWMDPGDGFAADVLAATAANAAPRPSPRSGWWSRAAETWELLARRPRIAMEGAYAAAAIAVLVLGFPAQSIAELPTRAFHSVRAEGASVEQVLSDRVGDFTALGRTMWNESATRASSMLGSGATAAEQEPGGLRGLLQSARDWAVDTWGPAVGAFFNRLAELWNEPETTSDSPNEE